ncbi:MAG: malonic semialdehyde reductase [Acidobacteriota bacterium]
MAVLDDAALRQLFLDARTHRAWLDRPVDDALLRRVYDLARLPPTSGNSLPMRLVFVRSAEAKERLRPTLDRGNVDNAMAAPITAIVAHDTRFFEEMTRHALSRPETAARFGAAPEAARERLAFQGGTLQGAYLILAARAMGLDCGPMGGFDRASLDTAFFPDGRWKSNFLVNLGYGDPATLRPRAPRLDFDDACRIE